MKSSTFYENEVPYGILEKFGLTHEMIEDLPMFALEDIAQGRPSPLLPLRVTDEQEHIQQNYSRFALVRLDDNKVDVMFYPALEYAPLDHFTNEQQNLLRNGKAIMADITMPDGKVQKSFVQIDSETNQVMAVPSPVIGKNIQVVSDELSLGSSEIQTIQKGDPLTFISDDQMVTVGIDLHSQVGLRFAGGDGQKWKEEGKREWDKYTFGCYGCWIMDDNGCLSYVPEEKYTDELWNEQKKMGERNVVNQRK